MSERDSVPGGDERPSSDRAQAHEHALRIIADSGCERCGPEQMRCVDWQVDDNTCWPCFARRALDGGAINPPRRGSRRSRLVRRRRLPTPPQDDDSNGWVDPACSPPTQRGANLTPQAPGRPCEPCLRRRGEGPSRTPR